MALRLIEAVPPIYNTLLQDLHKGSSRENSHLLGTQAYNGKDVHSRCDDRRGYEFLYFDCL